MKLFKRKVSYVLWAIAYAYFIFFLTQIIYSAIADGNASIATIGNMAMIIIFVITEKVEYFLAPRVYKFSKRKNINFFAKKIAEILIGYWTGPSFKAAMYFFYIVVIFYTALLAAGTSFIPDFPEGYLTSVRYGILLLIAADKFMEQIFKDIKNDAKILEEEIPTDD